MNLKNFNLSPLYILDKKWAVLTCGEKDKYNSMTISWGGLGTLWHKPVVTIYVRPNRYTYEFMENHEYYTISFYDDAYKSDLTLLGTKSGRDINKVELTNLTPELLSNRISFKEAILTIVYKKIYSQDLNIESIPKGEVDKFYNEEPLHRMFIGEVIDIIDRRSMK